MMDLTDEDSHKLSNLIGGISKSMFPGAMECPGCEKKLTLSIVENLDPYSTTMTLKPMPGRFITAKAVGKQILALVDLIKSVGDEMDHDTFITIADLGFDKSNGEIKLSLAALPLRKNA